MVRALSDKLECAVCVPDFARYGTSKDANEILYRQGAECLSAIMDGVHAAETLGLLNIADIAPGGFVQSAACPVRSAEH